MPKVLLRNSVPSKEAKEYIDDYEITPAYDYQMEKGAVKVTEKPWKVQDDQGELSFSLMPPAVVVALIKQLVEALDL